MHLPCCCGRLCLPQPPLTPCCCHPLSFVLLAPTAAQVLLPRVPAASVAAVFSKNLCRTLADNLRDPTATLYAMSRRVMVGARLAASAHSMHTA